jgi:putative (di)nucleoside polyphosphate hydrolase
MSNKNLYRPNVGIVIFNSKKKIWCGRRLGINTKDAWQLPQGGIDDNESPLEAAVREAYEETGIKSIKKLVK